MSLIGRQVRILDEIREHTEDIALVVYEGDTQLGIQFSKDYGLHNCNEYGNNGCCWYIDKHPSKFALLNVNARFDKGNDDIFEQFINHKEVNGFKVAENGSLIKLIHDGKNVLILNYKLEKILSTNISTEEEKVYANHVLSFYNILEGKGFDSNFNLADVKKTEVTPVVKLPKMPEMPTVKQKVYETEEELLRSLGIKQP